MSNDTAAKLVIACPVVVRRSGSTLYLPDREVTLSVPAVVMRAIIEYCDGSRTRSCIIKQLANRWNAATLRRLLTELCTLGAVVSSREMSDAVWPYVINPVRFFESVSDDCIAELVAQADQRHQNESSVQTSRVNRGKLQTVIEARRSIRTFSVKPAVPQAVINRMLWSGYGVVGDHLIVERADPQRVKVWQRLSVARRTVPSAGALYPLCIHLVLFKPTNTCAAGIYRVWVGKPHEVGLTSINDHCLAVVQAFADPMVCQQAQGVIVISGSFKICGEKYGNRGLLYVPLEAGHVAQNILLTAADSGVGTVEIGGFLEASMRSALQLPVDYWPLSTIVFGYPAVNEKIDLSETDLTLTWATSPAPGYRLPFTMAFGKVPAWSEGECACGRAVDPALARIKALAETAEWAACGTIPDDLVYSTMSDVVGAVDPREIVMYHPRQYRQRAFPFQPFSPSTVYTWKMGTDIFSGQSVHLLADLIYFPYAPRYPCFSHANSSGAAAHPSREEAIRRATLELVERDAFMISYLNRLRLPMIAAASLPTAIQVRLRALRQAGFTTTVKDLTMGLAPVALVFAQNHQLTFTTCAGCADFDFFEAVDHALMEVESAVYCRLVGGQSRPTITPRQVHFTRDHGNLYEQSRYFGRADFLARGGQPIRFDRAGASGAHSWEALCRQLQRHHKQLLVVDLCCQQRVGIPELKTVKVFIPGVVPISFGFGVEPLGMSRVYDAPVQLGWLTQARTYGQLEKFPHLYT